MFRPLEQSGEIRTYTIGLNLERYECLLGLSSSSKIRQGSPQEPYPSSSPLPRFFVFVYFKLGKF